MIAVCVEMRLWAGRAAVAALALAPVARGALEVVPLAANWTPPAGRAVVAQPRFDRSGNTSVRNNGRPEWKASGYFQRNRDLGQVFTAPRDFLLESIVLRTGPGDAAFLPASAGARVFIQFFEVEGEPVLDDNGTPPGTDATHGFSKNHRCDDVIRGVRYRPLRVVRGGVLPDLAAVADGGRLAYMLWRLDGDDRLECRAGRRYAFLVGFEEPGEARGFTLANHNRAGDPAPPRLDDPADPYPGGWGIRREGDGTLPPSMRPGPEPPADPTPLLREALFPAGEARFAVSPTTEGYPDVDTYRDLEFYLFASGEPRAAYQRPPGPTLRELAEALGFHVGANFPNLYRHWVAPGEAGPGRFEPEARIARDHFTIMTAGWEIYPGHSWRGEGRYIFDGSDRYIAWCRTNGILFHGHGLGYVFRAGWEFPKLPVETAEERARVRDIYERYVRDTALHFRGRLHMWDVCNEHLFPPYRSGAWLMWNPREGPRGYWKAYEMDPRDPERGYGWYEATLRIAHEADPDARLVLLDFNNEIECPKSDTMYALCRTLLAKRLPLHGVGFQMHINTECKRRWWRTEGREVGEQDLDDAYFTSLARNIRRFADLGLEVWITEMSVDLDPSRPLEAELERQAEVYRRVFEVCLRESGMRGIKLWGVMDPQPPRDRPALRPYLFDEAGRPKPAFFAVRRALEEAVARRPTAGQTGSSGPGQE